MKVSKNGGTPNHPKFERFCVETHSPPLSIPAWPRWMPQRRPARPAPLHLREMAGLPMDRVRMGYRMGPPRELSWFISG